MVFECYNCKQSNPEGEVACSGCGVPLEVAGYRICGVLGQGGCGAVYTADALPFAAQRGAVSVGQRIALKQNFDPASLMQLQREFAVLDSLRHPNLPRYYEVFESAGNAYLVMEFVPGQNLEEVLRKQPDGLAESQVLGYALQLCYVLSYLHNQTPAILHRDVKPANIRLTPEGLIKLVDFGLLKQGTSQTRTGLRGLGTPEYAPLEQYGPGGTDPRSDIYSLGATCYHLLTGQPPLDAVTRAVAGRDPLEPPQQIHPEITPYVAEAVLVAMAVRPEDRYTDVDQFRAALLGAGRGTGGATTTLRPPTFLPGTPISADTAMHVRLLRILSTGDASATSAAYTSDGKILIAGDKGGTVWLWRMPTGTLWRTLRKSTAGVKSIACTPDGTLLLVGTAGGSVYLWRPADETLLRTLAWYAGAVNSVAVTPDGLTLATGDAQNKIELWRLSDGALRRTLEGHRGLNAQVRSVTFAPDGELLASASDDTTVRLWQVRDGRLLHTLAATGGYVHSVAFAPDGQVLAAGYWDKSVRLWRVSDGALLRTLNGHTSFINSVAFSPDGQILASGSYDMTVRLWRVMDGSPLGTLAEHSDSVSAVAFAPDGTVLVSASWEGQVRLWGLH